jgi:hypothetical protein
LPLLLPFCRPSTCRRLRNTCAQFSTPEDEEAGEGEWIKRTAKAIDALDQDEALRNLQKTQPASYQHIQALKKVAMQSAKHHIERDRSDASSNAIPSLMFLALRALAGIALLAAINFATDDETKDKLEKISNILSAIADGLFYIGGIAVYKLYKWWFGKQTSIVSDGDAARSFTPVAMP